MNLTIYEVQEKLMELGIKRTHERIRQYINRCLEPSKDYRRSANKNKANIIVNKRGFDKILRYFENKKKVCE